MSDTQSGGGSSSPVVETTSGAYRGVRDHWIHVWKGIRYAAPPVGENRWRRARPAIPHAGVVDATGSVRCVHRRVIRRSVWVAIR